MTIKITSTVSSQTIPANLPFVLKLSDSGRARVSLNISIGDNISIDFDETWTGSRETTVPGLPPGTYPFLAFVYAYRSGLGGDYDSLFELNHKAVAGARGTLATGTFNDGGSGNFSLIVK